MIPKEVVWKIGYGHKGLIFVLICLVMTPMSKIQVIALITNRVLFDYNS
jgi:hypothetical protein